MQIIVDANPIVSFLIKPSKAVELLFIEELELMAPKLLFEEIERNKDMIVQKSGLTEKEVSNFISILKQKIIVVPEEEFIKYREKADKICPDEKDITYFALALCLKSPIWSNEKKLKKQKYVNVYATHELMKMFNLK
jgi:predicted nucleic acid-binding protein